MLVHVLRLGASLFLLRLPVTQPRLDLIDEPEIFVKFHRALPAAMYAIFNAHPNTRRIEFSPRHAPLRNAGTADHHAEKQNSQRKTHHHARLQQRLEQTMEPGTHSTEHGRPLK